ncbi:MAG: flavodoxin family protein [Clostridia bacterium]|nr:flavodoxin family protein [Clostridia bacterium]
MKVLIINGSPHKAGTTATALTEAMNTLKDGGAEVELLHVGLEDIRGCRGCLACKKTGKCIIDDCVNEIAKKLDEADGLLIGSPVYYASPNGTLISLLDRLFYSSHSDKTMKVGAAVVCARRGGCSASFDVLNKYLTISGMALATSTYWNQVHGAVGEDALLDQEGLACMRNLARNMLFLMNAISLGKEKYGLPTMERGIRTNFIKR